VSRLIRSHRRGKVDIGVADNEDRSIDRERRRREGVKGKDRGRERKSERKDERKMTRKGGGVAESEAGIEAEREAE